jgi:catechol 2,3-dioxygenase-like lactoylglutathione lyase family enzyme
MLGRFHELSVRTDDIRASVEFYEALGFSQCRTGDTWPHPYGVLTDGRIFIGLHQYRFPSPSVTCVRAGVARLIPQIEALGIPIAFRKIGDDCFNEFGFRDPGGQMITVLEARTYFPTERPDALPSDCGRFVAFGVPAPSFDCTAAFWETLGFVALELVETPWMRRDLISDDLNLALHSPRFFDSVLLHFAAVDAPATGARLRERGASLLPELPPGLDPGAHALLRSPEGLHLLISPDTPD